MRSTFGWFDSTTNDEDATGPDATSTVEASMTVGMCDGKSQMECDIREKSGALKRDSEDTNWILIPVCIQRVREWLSPNWGVQPRVIICRVRKKVSGESPAIENAGE
jgi:hypothetical protein